MYTKILSASPMVVNFGIDGIKFMCLNAGLMYRFNKAESFVVECNTQDEIDYTCGKLTECIE